MNISATLRRVSWRSGHLISLTMVVSAAFGAVEGLVMHIYAFDQEDQESHRVEYAVFVERVRRLYPNHQPLHNALAQRKRREITHLLRTGAIAATRRRQQMLNQMLAARNQNDRRRLGRKLGRANRSIKLRDELQQMWCRYLES